MKNQQKRNLARPVIATLMLALTLFFGMSTYAKNINTHTANPKTYILVHGAFQAPYAWQFVKVKLEAAGQKVVVVELPGHGTDQTDPKIITINTYRDKVIASINSVRGKVVLVGHSLGGAIITAVADSVPERIEKMVYIAAFVPANGQSVLDLNKQDKKSKFGPAIVFGNDGTVSIPNDKIMGVFAQDGDDAVKRLLIDNNRPEPIAPQTNVIPLTNPLARKIARYYVYTIQDQALSYDLQQQMANDAGIKNTYSLATGHCPFLTQPGQLSAILLKIAK